MQAESVDIEFKRAEWQALHIFYSRGKRQNTLYDRTASASLIFQTEYFFQYLCEAEGPFDWKLWKVEKFRGIISGMI